MTIFARSLHCSSTSSRSVAVRGLILAGCLLVLALAAAPPAGAVVTKDEGTTVGLQPRNQQSMFIGPLEVNELGEGEELTQPANFANPSGSSVVHGSAVYLIYWDPTNHYHNDWKEKIDEFMEEIGGASNSNDFLSVATQYTDKTNQPAFNRLTFRGTAEDTEAYPPSECADPHPLEVYELHHAYPLACLTDQQMHEQLQHYIAVHALPTGMNTIYYLLTPPGLTVCLDRGGSEGHCSDFQATKKETEEGKFKSNSYKNSFCSYHSDVNPGGLPTGDPNTVLYSVIPWTAGGLHDGQFGPADRTQADYCQDGGFNPITGTREKKPIQQEPNQPEECPAPIGDGFCDTGLSDLIINQIAEEQQNTETNPLLNAWQDPAGNEATDECRNFFGPVEGAYAAKPGTEAGTLYNQSFKANTRHYYINDAFNLAGLRLVYPGVPCLPGTKLEPKFTAPNPVNANDIVSFDGMESNITLNSAFGYAGSGAPDANYATYKWNFGDGSTEISGFAPGAPVCSEPWLSPCAASVFHSYTYGGEYHVTLTVTDVGGNTASIVKTITVIGPPPPPPPTPGVPGTSGAAGTTSGAAAGTPGVSPTSSAPENVPAPIVSAAIVSRSLKSTLGKAGLVVRYSVNEQVAGHFEVMLSRTVARKLGIAGTPATGLAAGTQPQIVVAKAILVTTKGGSSTVHIQYPKRTAARLHRLRSLSLTLRLSVRNAASHLPTATTVLALANLSH